MSKTSHGVISLERLRRASALLRNNRMPLPDQSSLIPMTLVLQRAAIRNNWDAIQNDPDNPRPDIKTADEFIAAIERGGLVILGAVACLVDDLNSFQTYESRPPKIFDGVDALRERFPGELDDAGS